MELNHIRSLDTSIDLQPRARPNIVSWHCVFYLHGIRATTLRSWHIQQQPLAFHQHHGLVEQYRGFMSISGDCVHSGRMGAEGMDNLARFPDHGNMHRRLHAWTENTFLQAARKFFRIVDTNEPLLAWNPKS